MKNVSEDLHIYCQDNFWCYINIRPYHEDRGSLLDHCWWNIQGVLRFGIRRQQKDGIYEECIR